MLELLWNAPVSEAQMAVAVEALALGPGQAVLDVGCGCGEVLIRLHERFGIRGLGIDNSSAHIGEARRRAIGRVQGQAVQFKLMDARDLQIEPESFDAALCLGASHAFGLGAGAFQAALARLSRWVMPGGQVLIAEGFLKRPAAPAYREVIGDFPPDEQTHEANIAAGRELGLIPLTAWTSSVEEWDHFEGSYQQVVERQARERPLEPTAIAKLARRRRWMDAYLQWGRDTLGYGTYLFQRPSHGGFLPLPGTLGRGSG